MQMAFVERNFAQEPSEQSLVSFLRHLEFAGDLTDLDCRALAELVELRSVPAGHVILGEGEKSEALFAVWSGAVEVLKRSKPDDLSQIAPLALVRSTALAADSGDHVKVTVLERGAIFGEMSFVDHRPTSATVRAVGDTTLLVWQREQLKAGPEGLDHRLLRGVAVALIGRMRSMTVTHVRALRDQLHQAEARLQFARLFWRDLGAVCHRQHGAKADPHGPSASVANAVFLGLSAAFLCADRLVCRAPALAAPGFWPDP